MFYFANKFAILHSLVYNIGDKSLKLGVKVVKMDIQRTISNLKKHRFDVFFVETAEDVLKILTEKIPQGSEIGSGGSLTIKQLEIMPKLHELGYKINLPEYTGLEYSELHKINRNVEYYFSGSNAITETGELINIDGTGNRIANMIFGVRNLFVIAGVNKITDDIQSGIERVRNVAAPPNCIRLNKNTPCAKTSKCAYCDSEDTICNVTSIHHHPTRGTNMTIILVNQNLGY